MSLLFQGTLYALSAKDTRIQQLNFSCLTAGYVTRPLQPGTFICRYMQASGRQEINAAECLGGSLPLVVKLHARVKHSRVKKRRLPQTYQCVNSK